MKSKRFKAGISRMKIPDENNGAADTVSREVIRSYHKECNQKGTGVYYPESILLIF